MSVRTLGWISRSTWLALSLCLTTSAPSAAVKEITCLDALSAFAAQRDIMFAVEKVIVAERWAGAGHEVKRLPGVRLRLPVAHCEGSLAVDFTEDCRLVRTRGEGGCRSAYPVTYY